MAMSKTHKVEVTATTVLEVCAENAHDAQTLAMIALDSHNPNSDDHVGIIHTCVFL